VVIHGTGIERRLDIGGVEADVPVPIGETDDQGGRITELFQRLEGDDRLGREGLRFEATAEKEHTEAGEQT